MYRTIGATLARVIVAIALMLGCGNAQIPNTTRIDALAQTLLSRNIAGISIAVARNGKVVFAHGYGMANIQHSVAVTPETVFHIDSVSKNILSAVLPSTEVDKEIE